MSIQKNQKPIQTIKTHPKTKQLKPINTLCPHKLAKFIPKHKQLKQPINTLCPYKK